MIIHHDYSPLFTIIHHYSPLFTIIHHYSPLFTIIHHYSPLFTIIHHYSPLFTIIHHYSPLYIHHSPLISMMLRVFDKSSANANEQVGAVRNDYSWGWLRDRCHVDQGRFEEALEGFNHQKYPGDIQGI